MTPSLVPEANLVLFFRIFLGLIFTLSALGKAVNVPEFIRAIRGFQIVTSPLLTALGAYGFLAAEFAVVVLLVLGGTVLLPAFLLAGILLAVFTAALISVLARRLQVPCNCFGSSAAPVNGLDVFRNVVLIVCAGGGASLLAFAAGATRPVSWPEGVLAGVSAAACCIALLNLNAYRLLFQLPFPGNSRAKEG